MSWQFVHILLLTALAFLCLHITRKLVGYFVLALCWVLFLTIAFLLGVIIDAHVTHAQLISHKRNLRHQRFFMQTPVITIGAFKPGDLNGIPPDYRALTNQLQHCLISKQECRTSIGPVEVHSGLPTKEDVEAGNGHIGIIFGGSWHGIFPKRPRLNKMLKVCGGLTESVLAFRAAGSLELPFPIVGFDYPTGKLATLNCGQTDDIAITDFMYQKLVTAHPDAKIVLMADCLGSLRMLNWLATKPANLSRSVSIILESPLTSVRRFLAGLSTSANFNELSFQTLAMIMPNYSQERETKVFFGHAPPADFPQIPIFIGMIADDHISGVHELPVFLSRFPNSPSCVFVARNEFVSGKPLSHGSLVRCQAYKRAVHGFLQKMNVIDSSTIKQEQHSPNNTFYNRNQPVEPTAGHSYFYESRSYDEFLINQKNAPFAFGLPPNHVDMDVDESDEENEEEVEGERGVFI